MPLLLIYKNYNCGQWAIKLLVLPVNPVLTSWIWPGSDRKWPNCDQWRWIDLVKVYFSVSQAATRLVFKTGTKTPFWLAISSLWSFVSADSSLLRQLSLEDRIFLTRSRLSSCHYFSHQRFLQKLFSLLDIINLWEVFINKVEPLHTYIKVSL